jgi:hypothetical protein
MSYPRAIVSDVGINKPARNGDGWLAFPNEVIQATDANQIISAAAITGGLYTRAGMTAGRSDTTDTAVNILAALAQLDIGDSHMWFISVQVAFALTLLAGAGVTLSGKTSVAASLSGWFMVTRTGAATVTIKGL